MLGDVVMISRPTIRDEVRLIGIDDSTTSAELACKVAKEGECCYENVTVGPIRPMWNGLGIAWARCPLKAAIKVAAMSKLRVGWTTVKVELLKVRPIQCFRC